MLTQIKKAVMGIVTDSTPVEDPKDTKATVFEIWSLFAAADEREEMFERARAGGLGYGDVFRPWPGIQTAIFSSRGPTPRPIRSCR